MPSHKVSVWPEDRKPSMSDEKTAPVGGEEDLKPGQKQKGRGGVNGRFWKHRMKAEDVEFLMDLAARGPLEKFKKYLAEDQSRVAILDQKGKGVLHHAATNGKIDILEFLLSKNGIIDVNQQDHDGNTPLHLAVMSSKRESVECLLKHEAKSDVANNFGFASVHMAVDQNKPGMIAAMAGFKVNLDHTTKCGGTALHYAAWKNYPEVVKALLYAGADMDAVCLRGMNAFHVAAQQGSKETMKAILDFAEEKGISTCTLLQKTNKENSNPLHAAVSSGDVEVVNFCMKAGGDISAQQDDKSTPLHLACAKGSLEMVKTMLNCKKTVCGGKGYLQDLNYRDAIDMTPLHHAAMFDHSELVEYLLNEGADINAQDNELRTPLFLASSKMASSTVSVLLTRGADVYVKDKCNRNFVHAAIINNCRLEKLGCNIGKFIVELLNNKDDHGCTPLHYASQLGHLTSMETLINIGAVLNPKNNFRESPLHFAARYGRYNSCRKLLSSKEGAQLINENDGKGQSALHMAAENGHEKVVTLLIKKGAVICKDVQGKNALHLAARNGYTRTIKTILAVHAHILNTRDSDGDTALHLAAKGGHAGVTSLFLDEGAEIHYNENGETFLDLALANRNRDVSMAIVRHERWHQVFNMRSKVYECFVNGFIMELPEVCSVVFDRFTTVTYDKSGSPVTTYCFRHLELPMDEMLEKRKNGEKVLPLATANSMVHFNRVELLRHPLMVNYLNMKWMAYGIKVFLINVCIYAIFLGSLTYMVVNLPPWHHTDNTGIPVVRNDTNMTAAQLLQEEYFFGYPYSYKFHFHPGHKVAAVIIMTFCLLNMIKEIIQMIQQRIRYFLDLTNLLEWILYITSTIFVCPSLFSDVSTHVQWECAAIATFLAWVNLLLYFQRSGKFGIYIVMFLEILKTLLEVLVVFFVLIVAFGLGFYILLSSKEGEAKGERSVGMSLLRSAMMMMGDYDFKETFLHTWADNDPKTMHFGSLTMMLLVVFILLMPILLMNLLIGLAVGDIESIQRNACLKRIAMQVDLHTDLERKLPAFILRKANKTKMVIKPCLSQHFAKNVFTKLAGKPKTGDGIEIDEEYRKDTFLYEELFKHKRKLKDLSTTVDKTFDLVRLIIRKMEIITESEEIDEGFSPSEGWQSALKKHRLQLAVLAKIKR